MKYPSPEEWIELVEDFESGDLAQKEFVAKHDVHLGTFQYWLYKTRKGRKRRTQIVSKSSPKFLPIQVVASPAPKLARVASEEPQIEAALPGGIVLRFPIGADLRYVAALLRVVG